MIHPKTVRCDVARCVARWQMVRIRWPASRVLGYGLRANECLREAKNTPYPASFLEGTSLRQGLTPIHLQPPSTLMSRPSFHTRLGMVSPPHTTLHGAWLSDFLIQTSSWSLPREAGTSVAYTGHLAGFLLSTSNMQQASQNEGLHRLWKSRNPSSALGT